MEPNLTPTEEKHGVCIRYFTPNPGKLVTIEDEEALKDNHVYDAEIYYKIGDMIPEVKSSLDRSGHVIVTDVDATSAIKRAERLIKTVELKTI
jgi:hypothetical protein